MKVKDICLYVESIALMLLILFTIFLVVDNKSSHEINDQLKEENYKQKTEIKTLREKKLEAENNANQWFNNYVDLGVACGCTSE